MPSMFLEDADDDDHVPCNLTRGTPTEAKPIHAAQASVEEEEEEVSTKKMISKYLKDTFGTRELDGSPKIKEGQDSAIVFEIQMNTKVCHYNESNEGILLMCADFCVRLMRMSLNLRRLFRPAWLKSMDGPNSLSWSSFSRMHVSCLEVHHFPPT